jgi:hypothetical protein
MKFLEQHMKKIFLSMAALAFAGGVAFADSATQDSSGGSVQKDATEIAPGNSGITTGTITQAPANSNVKCDEAAGSEQAKAACNDTPGVDTPSSSATPNSQQSAPGTSGGSSSDSGNSSGQSN